MNEKKFTYLRKQKEGYYLIGLGITTNPLPFTNLTIELAIIFLCEFVYLTKKGLDHIKFSLLLPT